MTAAFVIAALAAAAVLPGAAIARWRIRLPAGGPLLPSAAAGIMLFLLIESAYQAMDSVELSAIGSAASAAVAGAILVVGLSTGLIGLAWFEHRYAQGLGDGARRSALEVAAIAAVGLGLHNFAKGLALGPALAANPTGLGLLVAVGLGVHHLAEGFALGAPLGGLEVRWIRLVRLSTLVAVPTVAGVGLSGIWVSPATELLCLSLAAGAFIYVVHELFRLPPTASAPAGMAALAVGLIVALSVEIVIEIARIQVGLAR